MSKIKINTEALKTGRDWVRHKVLDGNNIFRVLPPFGDEETHKNYPFRRWVVAWLVDPKTNKRMPFATPFSTSDKDSSCPVYEYTHALSEKIEKLKAAMKEKNISDSVIKDKLSPLNKILWETRTNRVFAYNVVDKAGKVGLLELKKTAHDEMKKRMLEYITENQMDPTSLNSNAKEDAGVWFNIKRSGLGKDTKYVVEFAKTAKKDADGDTVYKLDRSPLPESVVDSFENSAYDLSTIYRQKNYSELREILLYNIALLAKEVPAAIIPGFEPDAVEPDAVEPDAVEYSEYDEHDEEVKSSAKSTVSKKNVSLSLDEEDEHEDEDFEVETVKAPVAKRVSEPVIKKASKPTDDSLDDLMAFADDLLGE
jgi:hypothetical protein